ncbi:nuclear transport factor 2 family protein [Novosphingobium sp.]|uniref:nuclear transport factor 2 family protein n=1 Tax=Novosphingobium sp. TaxID=1874826 RepID=UPI00345696D8
MTMTPAEIETYIDDLYAATGAGDWDKAASMLTDDFFVTEADCLPMAGVYRGKNALKDLFLKVMGMMDVAALDRGQTTVGNDCAVTLVSFRFADPALAPAELCELFRFRDGKVCEIRPYYFDPATVVAAVEAKKAAVSA